MKKIIFLGIAALVSCLAIFSACKKHEPAHIDEQKPDLNYSYNYQVSGNFDTSAQNNITNAGARLGRVLFYDKRLSLNNTIACASCHKQELAFSDNVSFSDGFNGGKTGRNSLAIINARSAKGFFWDHRTIKLEDMVLQPIRHQVEMGLDNSDFLIKKLNSTSFYPQLFSEAFGSSAISKEAIGKALAQFIYAMFVSNSKADRSGVLNGGWNNGNTILTADEQKGASLFQSSGCTSCHNGFNLRGWDENAFENIGLDAVYTDKGLGALLSDPTKDGVFKVPSLRNVELTAPYMHDGRYKTLEEVVEHYNSGIVYSSTLSYVLCKRDPVTYQPLPEAIQLNLGEQDKKCIVAFLKTLSDYSLVSDPKFSNPFK